jgi:anti-sigma regulatory factor (Ser/Thr protein kinase)
MARLEVELPASADAARVARAQLHDYIPAMREETQRENALLLTTELVTNAFRHGALSADDRITLVVENVDSALRVSIRQPTSASGVTVARAAPTRAPDGVVPGGLGLVIVGELADRWGVDVGPPGCVWFELMIPG